MSTPRDKAHPTGDKAHPTGWAQAPLEEALARLASPVELLGPAGAAPTDPPNEDHVAWGRFRADVVEGRVRAWACGNARHVHVPESHARDCCSCAPHRCRHGLSPRGQSCAACFRERGEDWEARRLAAAAKVAEADYTGPAVTDGDERFAETVAELLEDLEDDNPDAPLPTYVWGCVEDRVRIDADRLLEEAVENVGPLLDGVEPPRPEGVEALKATVEAFNALQPVACWKQDERTAVLVDPAHEQARLARRAAERSPS